MRSYPLRLAILYFLMASVWIFLTDYLVELCVPKDEVTTAQSLKGFGFIIVTAVGLYFIIRHYYHLIRKSESEYRKLFKDNPHPMWVYDIDTLRFLTVNNSAVIKYGYSSEEFYHLKISDIRPEEDVDSMLMFVQRMDDKHFHDSGVWRHKTKAGKIFFVKITSHSTNFNGKNARLVLAMDVDEQIQAQQKIQLSENKLKGLIDNSDDLIWMVDKQGALVTYNDAFQQKFNSVFSFAVSVDMKISAEQLKTMELTPNWDSYFQLAFGGKRLRVEEEVTNNNKKESYEIVLNPIHNDAGEVFAVGCFARDITQRKETEDQIRQQVNKLKEVAWIQSHEVRKPLANILGLQHLLSGKPGSAEQEELLNLMEASCKELDSVIKRIVEKSSAPDTPS